MGKLHTLQRAIQRQPEKFALVGPVLGERLPDGALVIGFRGFAHVPLGAAFRDGQWEPASESDRRIPFPYRQFVRTVLRKQGYDM